MANIAKATHYRNTVGPDSPYIYGRTQVPSHSTHQSEYPLDSRIRENLPKDK